MKRDYIKSFRFGGRRDTVDTSHIVAVRHNHRVTVRVGFLLPRQRLSPNSLGGCWLRTGELGPFPRSLPFCGQGQGETLRRARSGRASVESQCVFVRLSSCACLRLPGSAAFPLAPLARPRLASPRFSRTGRCRLPPPRRGAWGAFPFPPGKAA